MDKHGIKSVDPYYESQYNRNGDRWMSDTLRQFANEKGYQEFDMPIKGVDLSSKPFKIITLKDFIFHAKRLKKVNFNIPVILDDNGTIADGYHHVCKAFLEGKDTVKAIRLLEMPKPDNEE